jgi:arylsulfatase A-like enzyme
MTKSKFNSILLFSLLGWAAQALAATPTPPNVLFIAIDDLRPELGSFGSKQAKTPHIDKLAAGGLVFTRAYCQVPVCGASRASLMTGILPTRDRFINFNTKTETDAPGAMTLPEVFKNAGYTTLSNGKIFHIKTDTQDRSWSAPAWRPEAAAQSHDPDTTRRLSETRQRGRIFESPDVPDNAYTDGKIAEKTIEQLRGFKQTGKPFFIATGFFKPHMPFYAPKRYWDLYDREKIDIADNRYRPKDAPKELNGSNEYLTYDLGGFDEKSEEFHRMMRHGYLACISYVDKLTGDILEELDRLGLADNTIVVLWGDHGFHLGEHSFWGKHNTLHLSTRVPLIVKVPGKKGGTTSSIVETSDIFPTLCTLVGLKTPETVQGRSFSALLDNPQVPFREVAYSRYINGDSVISSRFNFTSYNGGKAHMLYDLEKDPDENINVVDTPEYREIREKMSALLTQRQEEATSIRK